MKKIRLSKCFTLILSVGLLLGSGCKKDWLEKKSDSQLNIPTTLQDVKEILDKISNNANQTGVDFAEISSDDYLASDAAVKNFSSYHRGIYLWQKDPYSGDAAYLSGLNTSEWYYSYNTIYKVNLCLEIIDKNQKNSANEDFYNELKAEALFLRGCAYYKLAQFFCKTYDSSTASSDPGIPMRLASDINKKVERGTVQQTYDQIIADLTGASGLMKRAETLRNTYSPGKAAIEGVLSRVYLVMGNYSLALQHSNLSIALFDKLLDYNTIDVNSSKPFSNIVGNPEILSIEYGITVAFIYSRIIPSELYQSYLDNDLRKTIFYSGADNSKIFKGVYYSANSLSLFTGITTDEVYLINAESKIRTGDIIGGISKLNSLLKNRYSNQNGGYQNYTTTDPVEALDLVLKERRKELVRRSIRWTDLRRLNKEPRYAKAITRIFDGKTYTLEPNDINYVLPIPPDEVNLNGWEQNPRRDITGK